MSEITNPLALSPEEDRELEEGSRVAEGDSIRPLRLNDFIGQEQLCSNLKIAIQAARMRRRPLDHVLLGGPPGLGKTTLAQIIAHEMGGGFHTAMAPNLTKRGDVAQILTTLQEGDVLFIDEIHRLATAVEEILYSAMEDHYIDIILGEGMGARNVRLPIQPFTLVGATTRTGNLSLPLQDRFGLPFHLDYYEENSLVRIIRRSAKIVGLELNDAGARVIARRCRRTPRVANRLLRRLHDFVLVDPATRESTTRGQPVPVAAIEEALARLGVDEAGLDRLDHRFLAILLEQYEGGPVGLKVMASLLGEEPRTVEDNIEPFLMREGFLLRTPQGRVASQKAWEYLGLNPARPAPGRQLELEQFVEKADDPF